MQNKDLEELTNAAKELNLSQLLPKVYEDALQPATQEVGKSLKTISKTLNIALAPVSSLVWGYEKIEAYIKLRLEEKFKKNTVESINVPAPNIAVPLLESFRYTAFQEELRDMYINLLATSMDKHKAVTAHPSFVEILKQLSPDEARLLSYIPKLPRFPDIISVRVHSSWAWGQMVYSEVEKEFALICKDAELEHPSLTNSYLDNLRRLLIVEFRQEVSGKIIDERQRQMEIETDYVEYLSITQFGQNFISACVDLNY